MQPLELLAVARSLIEDEAPGAERCGRAISTIYYALFHHLAGQCSDLLIGTGADVSREAWRQTYRALDHAAVRERTRQQVTMRLFPKQLQDFAETFVTLQVRRQTADYDPIARFTRSEVESDLVQARQAIAGFGEASEHDRRAFCAFVLLRAQRR